MGLTRFPKQQRFTCSRISGGIIALLSILLLAACASDKPTTMAWASYDHVDTTSLNDLEDLQQDRLPDSEAESVVNPIRLDGLKEAAMTLGAQGALAMRSEEVNEMLTKNGANLDQIFNFYALLLDDDVIPPIIVEGQSSLNLNDDDTIRIADKTYRIIQQARFATTVPNWRNYLWLSFAKPDVPDPTLLPKPNNPQEIKAWKKYVKAGWEEGEMQATNIFAENLARLKRDYEGMALYLKLLNENMISPPMVAKTELGITGDGTEMSINDRFKRITAHPELNLAGEDWNPAVAQEFTQVAKSQQGEVVEVVIPPEIMIK